MSSRDHSDIEFKVISQFSDLLYENEFVVVAKTSVILSEVKSPFLRIMACKNGYDIRYPKLMPCVMQTHHVLLFLITFFFMLLSSFPKIICHCRFCHIPWRCHYSQQHSNCKCKLVLGSSSLANQSEGHTMGQCFWKP